MKFRFLKVFCLIVSFLPFFGCTNTPKENDITIVALHELLQNDEITVLDVRTPEEISQGKITSKALEANFYDDNFIEVVTAKISKEDSVYVYCKGGRRSAKAVVELRELGYLKAYSIEGGIKAWKAKGYKVEN